MHSMFMGQKLILEVSEDLGADKSDFVRSLILQDLRNKKNNDKKD